MVSFQYSTCYMNDLDDRKNQFYTDPKLNFIDRFRLERCNDLIYKIYSKIENESGWEYTHDGFSTPSNFRYTGSDIEFDIHRVLNTSSLEDCSSERERDFLKRYQSLLKQLDTLEKKRSKFLLPSSVIPFDTYSYQSAIRRAKRGMGSFLNTMFAEFLIQHPNIGIEGLVSALNTVSDSQNTMDAMHQMKKKYPAYFVRKDLLKWISHFSKRGSILFERTINEKVISHILSEEEPSSFMKDESDLILRSWNHK